MFQQVNISEKQKLIQNVPPRHHSCLNKPKQRNGRRERIISLTSIPSRMDDMHIAVYSLLNQTAAFDRLVLWLGNEFFPHGEEDIPPSLLKMKQYGLEIRFRKDLGPYTKLVHALREFPEADVITADDDFYYPETWLQQLVDAQKKFPKNIIAHRCHGILLDPAGNVKKYSEWRFERVDSELSYKNFLTGVGGVLYPAHALHPDASNESLFMKISPTNDDVWFWTMALLNRRKILCIENPYVYPEFINLARHLGKEDKTCLHFRNVGQHGNDQYFQNVFRHYPQLKNLLQEQPSRRPHGAGRVMRHWLKMFLPYGLVRFYQKRTYGNNFSPVLRQPEATVPPPAPPKVDIRSYCPYCGNTEKFEPCGGKFIRPRGKCAVCKSHERDRALFYVFQVLIVTPRTPVALLHMAPDFVQYNFFRKYDFIRYTSMDLCPERYPYAKGIEKQDALHTTFPDNSFDFIIANHVLEHLDETAYFKECRRLLKPAGKLILTIPVFWDKETFRDDQLCSTPELREQYYGQKDHVIRYGSDVYSHLSQFGAVQMLRASDLPPFGDDYNTNIFIITFSEADGKA